MSVAKNILKVVLKVWSLDQEHSIARELVRDANAEAPSQICRTRNWSEGPAVSALTNPPGNLMDACIDS